MNITNSVVIDIETLGTPEHLGYGIVIPNLAFVGEPFGTAIKWTYMQFPVSHQLEKGLGISEAGKKFWFETCQKEFNKSYNLVLNSFCESTIKVYSGIYNISTQKNIFSKVEYMDTFDDVIKYIKQYIIINQSRNTEVWGNGSHFDCSILEEVMRVLSVSASLPLWHYASPQSTKSVTNRFNHDSKLYNDMVEYSNGIIEKFFEELPPEQFPMQLHNPLYDALYESLMISQCKKVLTDGINYDV